MSLFGNSNAETGILIINSLDSKSIAPIDSVFIACISSRRAYE